MMMAAGAAGKAVDDAKFACLRHARRLWAIGPAGGDLDRLRALHRAIAERVEPGDRFVYLGGMIGRGPDTLAVIDEILSFRRQILALPFMFPFDLAYLRGQAEEIWSKLLQLQNAAQPRDILTWMLGRGIGAVITAYGGDPAAGVSACRMGATAIARWTGALRLAQQGKPGHGEWMSVLKRAAYTDTGNLLFVHAGIDPGRDLGGQGDAFWWGHPGLADWQGPYGGFRRLVRGSDPLSAAPADFLLTLDGAKGRPLLALLSPQGDVIEAFAP